MSGLFGGGGNSGGNGNNNQIVVKPITGLMGAETILGLDMRPLNGQLYALGSSGNIYTINASSGLATFAFALSVPLSGTSFGFDFNPLVDRIRIVSNTGQNLRVNPNDGAVLVDGALNPGTPAITAVAYTNNFAGTATTTLFGIDANTDALYQINPPNAGTVVPVGNLNRNITAAYGFDIGGTSDIAYAVLRSGNNAKIFRINTTTGASFNIGSLGNVVVTGFTVGLGF